MISAEASYTNPEKSHLRLVISYPDGHRQEATAVSEGEARRLVFFYNRLYISATLKNWIIQRGNVFRHVNDPRASAAALLFDQVDRYSKTSLRHLCQLVLDKRQQILGIAPGVKSPYYKTYEQLIIPIINFCLEMKGAQE